MTKGIVDLFKTVDVKKQQITFAALLRFVDPALALLHQHPAVRQVRQRIIIGQILDQSFVTLIVSDIGTAHHMGQSAVHPAERRAEHPEPGTIERPLIIPGIDLRRFTVLIDQLFAAGRKHKARFDPGTAPPSTYAPKTAKYRRTGPP